MFSEIRPEFGYRSVLPQNEEALAGKLERIGLSAIRRRFAPEFINRIDAVITYEPLGQATLEKILDHQLSEFQQLVYDRLDQDSFDMEISDEAVRFLLREGTSPEFGARELKRTIHRNVIQPVSARVSRGELPPGCVVQIHCSEEAGGLEILTRKEATKRRPPKKGVHNEPLRLTA